jgi:ligand-binding sensor domain-containing protein
MKTLFLSLSVLILTCHTYTGFAQNDFEHVTELQSNNNSSVFKNSLCIDNKGMLWYSSYNGVYRYNGISHDFFEFKHPKNKDVANVEALYFDKEDASLYIATVKGVCILSTRTGQQTWFAPSDEGGVVLEHFVTILKDANGALWFGTKSSICYTLKHGGFKAIKTPISCTRLKLIVDEYLIFYCHDDYYSFNTKTGVVSTLTIQKNNGKNLHKIITENGALLPKNTSGSYMYNNKIYNFKYFKDLNIQIIESPFKPHFTKILYANIQNLEAQSLVVIRNEFIKQLSFVKKQSQWHLTETKHIDINGNFNGINKFSPILDVDDDLFFVNDQHELINYSFEDLAISYALDIEESEVSCRSFTEDTNGTIHVLTNKGLFKKDSLGANFEKIELQDIKRAQPFQYYQLMKGFYKHNDSLLYFYGYQNFLYKANLKNKTITGFGQSIRSKGHMTDVIPLNEQLLLVGLDTGLVGFDVRANTFQSLEHLETVQDYVNGKYVSCLLLDQQRRFLWIGMKDNLGLLKVDIHTQDIIHYRKNDEEDSLLSDNIIDIYEDTHQNVWIGTDKGVQVFEHANNNIYKYCDQRVGSNYHVTKFVDFEGRIWFGTYHLGIGVIEHASKRFLFLKDDRDLEYNQKSAFISRDSTMYFGSIDGIAVFNPKDMDLSKRFPNIELAGLTYFNDVVQKNQRHFLELDTVSQIIISPFKNFLTLEFAANNVLYPKNLNYKYRFANLNEDWIDMKNTSALSFYGLQAGDYNLEVKGFSEEGLESNTLYYNIAVNQVIYKQSWFLLTVILSGFAAIVIFSYRRRKRIKEKYKTKLKELELQSKMLLGQMNPHFTFNIINSLQTVAFFEDKSTINKYFIEYSNLLRQTLTICNKEQITMHEEVKYLRAYVQLESFRIEEEIQFVVIKEDALDDCHIPSMLLQPIIENAINHGLVDKKGNKQIVLSFKRHKNQLTCIIEDNGMGRAYAQQKKGDTHVSWATKIMEKRARISTYLGKPIEYDIVDLNKKGKPTGTKVILTFDL